MKRLIKDILWTIVLLALIVLCIKAVISNWNLPVVKFYAGKCIRVIKEDKVLPCSCIDLKHDVYTKEYINYEALPK